ncbi:MAG: hypothetical protein WED00_06175 [Aquisalimonadaceae bacterium]
MNPFAEITARGWGLLVALALIVVGTPLHVQADNGKPYEIWALDQGTHKIHVYDADLREVSRIDLGAHGAEVPHMIDFTSDYRFAVVANVATGNVALIRTEDHTVVDLVQTGPRTHMAGISPDDRTVLTDVIGNADNHRDGKIVELSLDADRQRLRITRELVIANDPVFRRKADSFKDVSAICHDYSADGSRAFVTLGPSLENGGLVVVNTRSLTLERAWGPGEMQVNCGTMLTPDGRHMMVNGGGHDTGHWFAIDTDTLEIASQGGSEGTDAHGVRNLPNGEEVWMVNRGTSNGIVLNARTLEQVDRIQDTGKTPDILDFSPDSRYAFVTLRGPNPVSMPHMAKGETPGFSVMDVASREVIRIVQPAANNPDSDFHGIGVRVLR